jgi:signal transduction histidine kinase
MAANPSAERLLGWSADELRAQGIGDTLKPTSRTLEVLAGSEHHSDQLQAALATLHGRTQEQTNESFTCADGTQLHVIVTFSAVWHDGHAIGVVISFRDFGDVRAREKRLSYLIGEIQRVRSHERARIAGELHDFSLQQMIAALMGVRSSMLGRNLDARSLAQLRTTEGLVKDALDTTRRIMQGLTPVELELLDLRSGVERAAEQLRASYGVPIEVDVDLPDNLDEERLIAVYRVLVEALTNAAKHARATHIEVRARLVDGQLVASVADDGRGIDHTPSILEIAPEPGAGMGMALMVEQVTALGGTHEIVTAPDAGTTVAFQLPVV